MTKKKTDSTDTLKEVQAFMTNHFVIKKSEYTEVQVFRQAQRHDGETVSDYAMRLRVLATHCKYTDIKKEIERQFVCGCRMEEVQRKCCRTDTNTLASVLEMAIGFERVNGAVNGLLASNHDKNMAAAIRINCTHASKPTHAKYNSTNGKNDRPYKTTSTQAATLNCLNCGKTKDHDKANCPAQGSQCSNCGKMNHYARVCMSEATNQNSNMKPQQYKKPDNGFKQAYTNKTQHKSQQQGAYSENRRERSEIRRERNYGKQRRIR